MSPRACSTADSVTIDRPMMFGASAAARIDDGEHLDEWFITTPAIIRDICQRRQRVTRSAEHVDRPTQSPHSPPRVPSVVGHRRRLTASRRLAQ